MIEVFKSFIKAIQNLFGISRIIEDQKILKISIGKQLANYNKINQFNNINEYEFKIFSQFGDDGLIQYLIDQLVIEEKKFVEFGVESYDEANTRFLLENNSWEGLIIDASKKNINYVKRQTYFWKHKCTAVSHFIDQDNINEIITKNNFSGNIGLLSIDIDGNDYWIWECINVVYPDIVIIEYNARLGFDRSITIPYEENFQRGINQNKIIYGASLKALYNLGIRKGYSLVGTNMNGNNAFFVKKEALERSNIKAKTPSECFHSNSFSELRDNNGNLIRKDLIFEENVLNSLDLIEV